MERALRSATESAAGPHRADRYPSVSHMNMLEQIATSRVLVEYTPHLFDRIEADKYPSIPMQRVQGLVARWGLELPPG